MDDFKPDVCHLNNFNYQLTPSIILEVVKWRKKTGRECRIIYTAHDYQLICPNHMMNNPVTHENCENCMDGHFISCTKGKCIHESIVKSAIGTAEAYFWRWKGVYRYIDKVICCSEFIKKKLDRNPVFKEKTITLHNFIDKVPAEKVVKKDYVLYFGRFSREKGIYTLIKAAESLPEINFIFAGVGECTEQIESVPNIKNVGFQSGEDLNNLICEARFSVCPSEWYENCPFSVMESQIYGTPVIGARIGGIPELIKEGVTGELFESGNVAELNEKILFLWDDKEKCSRYADNCKEIDFEDIDQYYNKLLNIYGAGKDK